MDDFISHDIPITKETDKNKAWPKLQWVIGNVTQSIISEFPNTPVAFSFGNNDFLFHNQILLILFF